MRRALFALFPILALPAFALAQNRDATRGQSVMHDPPPLTEKTQWVFDLRWDSGDVFLVATRKIEMPQPMTTPRAMGRFTIELTDHNILIERTRFDFPGMAVPDDDGGSVHMLEHIRTRIGVFFPATSRGDKLELVDRITGKKWALAWPPQIGIADGGTG
jgi:hypothetical protein